MGSLHTSSITRVEGGGGSHRKKPEPGAVQPWPRWRSCFHRCPSEMRKSETTSLSSPRFRSGVPLQLHRPIPSVLAEERQGSNADRLLIVRTRHSRHEQGWSSAGLACSSPRQFEQTSCGSLLEIRFPQRHSRLRVPWESFSAILADGMATGSTKCRHMTHCCSPAWTVVGTVLPSCGVAGNATNTLKSQA